MDTPNAHELYVRGPAGALHVDDGGRGPGTSVVFVASYAGDTEHWRAQLAHLRPSRRAIAIDLRGHGRSAPSATNDYAIESFAADLGAVIDHLDLRRVILVGHSAGGLAALAYASKHPDRVAALLLVTVPGKLPAELIKGTLAGLESDYDGTFRAFWATLLDGARPEQPFDIQHLAPHVTTRAIAGTGHWVQLDKPQAFTAVLDEFLAAV